MIPFFFKKNKNSTCFFVRKHTNKGVLLVRAMRRLMAKMSFVEKQIKGDMAPNYLLLRVVIDVCNLVSGDMVL